MKIKSVKKRDLNKKKRKKTFITSMFQTVGAATAELREPKHEEEGETTN